MISRTLRRGRAFAALVTGAMVASLSIAGLALPASAAPAPVATKVAVTGGNFTWGVLESYREGLVKSENTRAAEGGASFTSADLATFPLQAQNSWDGETGKFAASGLVRIGYEAGPGGNYLRIENPIIEINGNSGTITATVSSRSHGMMPNVDNKKLTIANLDLNGLNPTVTDTSASWAAIPVTLTEDGRDVIFGVKDQSIFSRLAAGTALDSLKLVVEHEVFPVVADEPTVTPKVTVSKTTGLKRTGEQVTVRGSGFLPNSETFGKRPPLAGKFTGAYVILGQFAEQWQPSTGAPKASREPALQTFWGVHAEDFAAVGGVPAGATAINPDGTFEVTFNVSDQLKDFAVDREQNFGVYTYPGGGAKYAPFETFTKLTFVEAGQEPEHDGPSSPSPDATPTPTPTPDPTPTVDPPKTCESGVISDANLTWGVKESFRNYITGKIARGTTAVKGKNTVKTKDGFVWTAGNGTFNDSKANGNVSFKGAVQFIGHSGLLNVKFSDPKVTAKSKTNAVLSAKVHATDSTGKVVVDNKVTNIATLDLTKAKHSNKGGIVTYSNVPATLTAAGADAFIGFYDVGTALDPVSFVLRDKCSDKKLPTVTKPAESPQKPQAVKPVKDSTDTPDLTNPVKAVLPVTETTETNEQCTANSVSGASFSWGVKQAFTKYITGSVANGRVVTTGTSKNGGAFTWSGGSGSVNTEKMSGSARFNGSVNFNGHGGILNLTLSNPRVVLSGSSTGTLIVDVNGSNMDGDKFSRSGVRFATLNLAAGANGTTSSTISYSGVPATLTPAGAQAFAGFYDAGATLDPVSFTLPLGGTVACDTASGTLAKTGSGFEPIGLSASLLIVGLAAAVIARKRKNGIYAA